MDNKKPTSSTSLKPSKEKTRLHPRNRNRERYDLEGLIKTCPELNQFLKPNKHGEDSIDFANPKAVKLLNKALLQHYYGIANWDIPENYLCPPIPGRADYLHHMADLLKQSNYGNIPEGKKVICLDVGVGANCIYPIIGNIEYDWSFIGSDIDAVSIESAQQIVDSNPVLKGKIDCRLQKNSSDVFYGIIRKEDLIDLSICNPPFHASAKEALESTTRKVKNLSGKKEEKPTLNFGGQSNELWCEGGERAFILNLISQSLKYQKNCFWFSTLVSKQSNLKLIYQELKKAGANGIDTIPMSTGNKSTRIVAWTFLTNDEQKEWRNTRWSKPKNP